MLIFRPIERRDLSDFVALANQLDSMNLPGDPEFLESRIERSIRGFAGDLAEGEPRLLVFALEDCDVGRCVGTSMLLSKHGTPGHPYYWFEISAEERHSAELGKRFVHTKLQVRSTEDGPSEIGGLMLDPAYRRHPQKCGKALSTVRFAYMSIHPDQFERQVIAEMLSAFEAPGENLLWKAFGERFTNLSYREADHLSARDKQFITDLFPRDPVYATLFPKEVQAVIGKTNESAKAARRILEKVGFLPLNQVDPFDGGPHYGAARDAITSVRERRELVLPGRAPEENPTPKGPLALVSAEGSLGFRATALNLDAEGAPLVSQRYRDALGSEAGDRVHVTPLP